MRNLGLTALVFCLVLGVVKADIITVQVTAEITQFEDNGGYFDDSISVGSVLTMMYSYDTESLDSNAGDDYGAYYQVAPNIVRVEMANYKIQSDLENLDYRVAIGQNTTGDTYSIRSSSNLILPDTTINSHIYWLITYDSGTFDNTDLPTVAPDISPANYIQIGDGREFTIYATPISVEIIPEPISLLTLGLGGLIVRIKRS